MNDDQGLQTPTRGAYMARTPWGPVGGLIAGITVTLVAFATIIGAVNTVGLLTGDPTRIPNWVPMALLQTVMALGAIWIAGWFGGVRGRVLALSAPRPGVAAFLPLLAVFLAFVIPYTAAVYWFRPDVLFADNKAFAAMMDAPQWPIYAVIIAIGAPVSEELLVRGFMLPALSKSRLGFAGAALVTTIFWMALHYTYSIFGLIEIFVIGLILSWALWRTGSLWAPMALHAINNGALVIAMKFHLLPWT